MLRQVIWENGIEAWYPVGVGDRLYVMMGNVHGGGWIKVSERSPPSPLSS